MRHAILAMLFLATPAQAFTAQNGLIVRPEGEGAFTVPWRGRSGPADFWCAAGDYAVRVLHLPPAATIFRASEPPRRSGEGIAFTLRPEAAASQSGLLVIGNDDAGLSVGAAQAFCEVRRRPHD